jgi:hypothetical protein
VRIRTRYVARYALDTSYLKVRLRYASNTYGYILDTAQIHQNTSKYARIRCIILHKRVLVSPAAYLARFLDCLPPLATFGAACAASSGTVGFLLAPLPLRRADVSSGDGTSSTAASASGAAPAPSASLSCESESGIGLPDATPPKNWYLLSFRTTLKCCSPPLASTRM